MISKGKQIPLRSTIGVIRKAKFLAKVLKEKIDTS